MESVVRARGRRRRGGGDRHPPGRCRPGGRGASPLTSCRGSPRPTSRVGPRWPPAAIAAETTRPHALPHACRRPQHSRTQGDLRVQPNTHAAHASLLSAPARRSAPSLRTGHRAPPPASQPTHLPVIGCFGDERRVNADVASNSCAERPLLPRLPLRRAPTVSAHAGPTLEAP